MSVTYTPSNATIYETIRAWVKSATGYTDTSVYWDDQPVDQSPLPRAVLSVVSDLERGLAERRYEDDEDEDENATLNESMVATKELHISLEIHTATRAAAAAPAVPSAATDEAMDVLRKVLASVSAADTLASFEQVAIQEVSEARDISELVGSGYERRAQCDLTIGYVMLREQTGAIPIETFAPLDFDTE